MPEAGIPFGKYQLIKRLARGGMAEVFLARQHGLGGFERQVAVKRILPHLADTPDFVGMFLDEARLAARLTHPNIVHIYDFGQVEDHYFIAMEYVDGVHAGELIERGAQELMPCALVARIGADACAGLNYAHNIDDSDGRPLHLVHRDISPPNLMISLDGVVKLVDFGIAKAVSTVEKTRPGIVKGKFAYMSPEQTMGMKLDGRSDVFSLALVLWELLAGRVAVDRTDPVGAMTAIRDGRLPSIRQARPDIPLNLVDVLEAALEVEPTNRMSAVELGNAFEGFIKSSPELGTSMQLSQWIRQRYRKPALDPSLRDGPPATLRDGERQARAPGPSSGKQGRQGATEQPTMTSGSMLAPRRSGTRPAPAGRGRLDSEADRPTRAMAPAVITDENTAIDSARHYMQRPDDDDDDDAPTEIAPADDDGQPTLPELNRDPSGSAGGMPMRRPGPNSAMNRGPNPGPGMNRGPDPGPGRSPNPGQSPGPGPGMSPSGGGRPPVELQAPPTTLPPSTIPPGTTAAQLGMETRRPAPTSQPPPMGQYPQHGPPSNQRPMQPGHPGQGRNPRATGGPGFAGVPMDANRRMWVAAIVVFILAALIAVALLGDDEPVDPGLQPDAGAAGQARSDDSGDTPPAE